MQVALVLGWAIACGWPGRRQSRAERIALRVRRAAERLGPSFVKLGQIIASGQGVFPQALVEECAKLRDEVAPEPFATVRASIEDELGPLEALFWSFDETPLAAASIAQVHPAILRAPDGTPGPEVVVKVRRSGIERSIRRDMAALRFLADRMIGRIPVAALANPPALVELFAETLADEVDLRLEAANMVEVASSLARRRPVGLLVPRPHPELVSRSVLVMERLKGEPPRRYRGPDAQACVQALLGCLLEGALLDGVFHGDLHGGNLLVHEGQVGLIDFGITAWLDPSERDGLARLIVGGMTSDPTLQVQGLVALRALPADCDVADVVRTLKLDAPPPDPASMSPDELSQELATVARQLLAMGAKLPKALMLWAKDLVLLDAVIGEMAPETDMIGALTSVGMGFMAQWGQELATQLNVDVDVKEAVMRQGTAQGLGLAQDESLSWTELQERRALIAKRMQPSEQRRKLTKLGSRP